MPWATHERRVIKSSCAQWVSKFAETSAYARTTRAKPCAPLSRGKQKKITPNQKLNIDAWRLDVLVTRTLRINKGCSSTVHKFPRLWTPVYGILYGRHDNERRRRWRRCVRVLRLLLGLVDVFDVRGSGIGDLKSFCIFWILHVLEENPPTSLRHSIETTSGFLNAITQHLYSFCILYYTSLHYS